MLSNETIQSLLTPVPRTKARTAKSKGRQFTEDGWSNLTSTRDLGAFEGKVGSTYRSRKGATRRKANGRRYYVASEEILAYKLN